MPETVNLVKIDLELDRLILDMKMLRQVVFSVWAGVAKIP